MLINNVKIDSNKIVAILEENKKNIMNLEDFLLLDITVNNDLNSLLKDKKYDKDTKQKRKEELFKMVNLPLSFLDRKISTLSDSEKVKYYFAKKLIDNSDTIVIDDFFKYLDMKNKNKIIKILIKLKKYYNKSIYIYTNDLNNIYEFVDDIIYIENKKTYYNNKFDFFMSKEVLMPDIINFTKLLKKRCHNIKYKDSINELIKEIYRIVR